MVIYDLHDLCRVFSDMRCEPDYKHNEEMMYRIIKVLKNRDPRSCEYNSIRAALSSIPSLDTERYNYVFVKNIYTYCYGILKDERIFALLIEACEGLLDAIKEKNIEKVYDLADCLHNLPTHISEKLIDRKKPWVPEYFRKIEVKIYRKKWDKNFLKEALKKID